MLALLLTMAADAASLDNLEVGGAWGTPLATNPTAAWWNPAGLPGERGTRLLIEGAPTFATVTFDRDDPYNGGRDVYELSGAVPFAGLATDAGVDGLGFGIALAVPYVRGGAEVEEPGPGSFAMREGSSQAAFLLIGAGFRPEGLPLSIGLSGALVQSTWVARVDNELTTSLDHQISELGQDSGYTDEQIEDPSYATTLQFSPLVDTTVTFSAGLRLDTDKVDAGLTYIHGAYVDNEGTVEMRFGCPPQDDTLGRFGAEAFGLCNTNVPASAAVGYALPARVHGGVRFEPQEQLFVELMGGYVRWSAFRDFDIRITDVQAENERTVELLEANGTRLWARDNVDSFWTGIDVKGRPAEQVLVGGRVLYDRAAVPERAMSTNNYDASAAIVGALVSYEPVPWLGIGLQYSHHFLATRTVDESGFLVTLDEAKQVETRWAYPQMNGVYGGTIDRIGVSVRGSFGGER